MPNKRSALLQLLPGGSPLTHTGSNDSEERRQVKYSLGSREVILGIVRLSPSCSCKSTRAPGCVALNKEGSGCAVAHILCVK